MNERIQELILKATETVDVYNPDTGVTHYREFFDKEKFASMIIQECVDLIDTLNEAYDAPSTAGKFIKEHFGIE
jgi:hypothetical protein